MCLKYSSGLTVDRLFSPKSESDECVTKAARQVLCSPAENRPTTGHVQEYRRLLQMTQDLLDPAWSEGFNEAGGRHGL